MPNRSTRPPRLLLYAALLAHTLASAGTYLCAKRALAELPWTLLGLLRFSGASLCLALLLLRLPKGARLPPKEIRRRIWLLGFVAVPLNQGFFLGGLQLSTAAHAALLYALTPVFVSLFALALIRERPTARTAVGTGLALGGAVWVLLARGLDVASGPLVGDLLILVGVIAWAVYTAEGRELVSVHGALPMIAWTLIAGTLLYLPLGLGALIASPAQRVALMHLSREGWMGVGYLIFITSVAAYLLWYWALGYLPAARVAVFSNLQPLATALFAWAFLDEKIGAQFLAAAAVVIAGVLVAQSRPRALAAAEAAG